MVYWLGCEAPTVRGRESLGVASYGGHCVRKVVVKLDLDQSSSSSFISDVLF